MTKLTAYLSLSFICKLAIVGTFGAVAFKTSLALGIMATLSFVGYIAFSALAEREVVRREQEEIVKFFTEQAKALGGGSC